MIFLFFSSSLACLEPELELFEVWEINVRQIIIIANGINSQTPKLQTALAEVLDELERNQKNGKSSNQSTFKKNMTLNGHFSRPAETDPYMIQTTLNNTYRVSQKKHSYKIFGLEIMLFTCSQTLWSGLRSSFTKWGTAPAFTTACKTTMSASR